MAEKKDPVSGNEIPVGAMAHEVRDDVPAMLSEGEFVLPADVVRYIGLNNLMKLRDAAKVGLQQMEDQGQMGNGDEAITDETTPAVNMDAMVDETIANAGKDDVEKEMVEMAVGGTIPTSQTTPTIPPVAPIQPVTTPQIQAAPVAASSQQPIQSSQYTPVMTGNPQQPVKAAPTGAQAQNPYTAPDQNAYLPTNAPNAVEDKVYVGPNGERVTIRFVGGNPSTPIPEGYVPLEEWEKDNEETPTVETPTVETPTVQAPTVSSSSGDRVPEPPEKQLTDTKFALAEIMAAQDPEIAKLLEEYKEQYKDLDFSRMGIGKAIAKMAGSLGPIGMVKTIFDALQIGWAKSDLFDAMGDAEAIPGSILRDWNKSTRDSIAIMESAKAAMNLGASNNLSLAIAVDDNFDTEVLGIEGLNLSDWEAHVAKKYGLDENSDQLARLAKEEIDLYDGDLSASESDYNSDWQDSITAAEDSYDFDAEWDAFNDSDYDPMDAGYSSGGGDSGSYDDGFGSDFDSDWDSATTSSYNPSSGGSSSSGGGTTRASGSDWSSSSNVGSSGGRASGGFSFGGWAKGGLITKSANKKGLASRRNK